MRFEEALAYLSERRSPSEPAYLEACNVIADNLDKLRYRMFIHLPGGLSSNDDPAWERVKAASELICDCGNERVFEPRDMRHEFEPSAADPIVLSLGDTLYVRPVGAPASATYTKLAVEDSNGLHLTYLADPMSSTFDFESLFKTKGFRLSDMVEPLERQGKPIVLARDLKHIKQVPLLGIAAVDLDAGTITLHLDAAVEAFNPDEEEVHKH